jgi:hypothetical protein
MKFKRVFVCSPYSGDVERNTEIARILCLRLIDEGLVPFAPHLIYPEVLGSEDIPLRSTGIECGLEFLTVCDLLIAYTGNGITAGMQIELDAAAKFGIPVIMTNTLELTHDDNSKLTRIDNVVPIRRMVYSTGNH